MTWRPNGFTLLEVLLALLVITLGVLGLAATLGPITTLGAEGRARGRIALALESRLDRLRAELLGGAPACVPPPGGTERHPDGVLESWRTAGGSGLVDLVLTAELPGRRPVGPDTLLVRLSCP